MFVAKMQNFLIPFLNNREVILLLNLNDYKDESMCYLLIFVEAFLFVKLSAV